MMMVFELKKNNQVSHNVFIIISIVLFFSIFGCAAREKLSSYPERHIDRPYTLPKGTNLWKTTIYYANYKDQDNGSEDFFLPYPFIWNQPITDNFNLIWSPLPLSFQYQFVNTEKHTAGVSGGTGIGYSSDDGLFVNPLISGYYKIRLGDSIAIENYLTAEKMFGDDDDDDSWRVEYRTGPLFQILDRVAISPRLHLAVDNSNGRAFNFDSDHTFEENDTQYAFPVSLWIGWSLHKQLELNFDYTYRAFGYSNDFIGHEFTVSIDHLW